MSDCSSGISSIEKEAGSVDLFESDSFEFASFESSSIASLFLESVSDSSCVSLMLMSSDSDPVSLSLFESFVFV